MNHDVVKRTGNNFDNDDEVTQHQPAPASRATARGAGHGWNDDDNQGMAGQHLPSTTASNRSRGGPGANSCGEEGTVQRHNYMTPLPRATARGVVSISFSFL
jgi:hypothetical protein